MKEKYPTAVKWYAFLLRILVALGSILNPDAGCRRRNNSGLHQSLNENSEISHDGLLRFLCTEVSIICVCFLLSL
jgi:hypothetical protein